jgi:hypothetical protein
MLVSSKFNYHHVKVGDTLIVLETVKTPKGACDFYKCVAPNSVVVHYMFTAEVTPI